MSDQIPLMGEIITWSTGRVVGYAEVKAALSVAGLPTEAAKEMLPRSAFSRAAKQLIEDRIINKVSEDKGSMVFQLNQKHANGNGKLDFPYEDTLTLDKDTGAVACNNAELASKAKTEMDKALSTRTPGDVTRIVQKLFEDRAGLWAIRDQGGAYFVPVEHQTFTASVETFLVAMGGRMRRFPVPKGTPQGNAAVRETLATGIAGMIAEHNVAVDAFDDDSRGDTLERRAEKIQRTRLQIDAYATYLESEKDKLITALEEAKMKLVAKINQKAAETESSGGGMLPLFTMI